MDFANSVLIAVLALAAEAVAGYPDALYRAIGHPVTWIGGWIGLLERRLNTRGRRGMLVGRLEGIAALVLILALPGVAACLIATALPAGAVRIGVLVILAASLPAQRSLFTHVRAVADGLDRSLADGRAAVSMIVGRNPAYLDEAGVARAAIESLAENFSDGVVAPAFWTAVGGLTGGVLYKAANTADSMIGHRTPRHEAFGWAAARFDDLVNLPASRLSACFILTAAAWQKRDWRAGLRAVRRDAGHHRSPNAGWPEAAMAGALGVRLAGPRVYGETLVADGWMGDGRAEATPTDLRQALALYRAACAMQILLLALIVAVLSCFR